MKARVGCIVSGLICFFLVWLVLQGNTSVGQVWDGSHETCLGVSAEGSLMRLPKSECNQPWSLASTDVGNLSLISFVGVEPLVCLTRHPVLLEEVSLQPCTSSPNQLWVIKDRQIMSAEDSSHAISQEGRAKRSKSLLRQTHTKASFCLTTQNGLFNSGKQIGVRRCAKGNRAQFWSFEADKNILNW